MNLFRSRKRPTPNAYQELERSLDDAIILACRAGIEPRSMAALLTGHISAMDHSELQRQDHLRNGPVTRFVSAKSERCSFLNSPAWQQMVLFLVPTAPPVKRRWLRDKLRCARPWFDRA
jgi:hypothetical protein